MVKTTEQQLSWSARMDEKVAQLEKNPEQYLRDAWEHNLREVQNEKISFKQLFTR
ncbi:hypothetical protein KIM372_16640 [Bombiscardovia nodaiensis]|uniref:Uncharacterized protein n=1 Tax=Bombiscardovia nodaiensis TaxID=2932181 RepID=A0ABM8BA61_9BIFI|nr:hypothetical protein KIM372_16640 [Bombiscardovia nodaiensis]